VERELRRLVAENAIQRVVLTYCRGVDRMDLELIRSVFHHDAIDDHSARYSGPGVGFADYLARSLPAQNFISTSHQITNSLISVESEDRASAETYFMVAHANGTDILWMLGRYLDVFERREGEWKILHRRVVHDMNYLTPATEAFSPSDFLQGQQDRSDPSYSVLSIEADDAAERCK
jgi:SnoaL-like domain